ncbi:MAG: phosphoglucosamine mutase [Balneolaceae bacterium]
MALIVSVSGIRGIFGSHLTPENLVTYSAAYGSWLKGGTVVVGRDTRLTGEICEEIVTGTLRSTGCDVIRLGVAPTPTVAMEVLRHKAAGGIVLTASHNPEQWNALKLLNGKSEFLDEKQGSEVLSLAKERNFDWQEYDQTGSVKDVSDALQHHIRKILDLPWIDPNVIGKARFSVAVDAVNGAGSDAIPALLKALSVKRVETIHCTPNGRFPHNPEPLPEHLEDICELVQETKCDLGFVTDPDADRLAVVDENGQVFGEEYTQVAAFDFLLEKTPGDTATNLSSSRAADDITERYGKRCHRSAVGEINVVKAMQNHGAVIGGEGNGGVILPDLHYGRDALAGVAMVLQLLAERKLKASDYRQSLPHYEMSKSKILLEDLGMEAGQVLDKLKSAFQDREPDTTDGVKIDFEEGWVHFRKSNTEPVVRVYSEAKTAPEAERLAKNVLKAIR